MSVTTPVDVTVISFKGSHFHGEIVPALEDVVERGLIRIIDLVFVSKDLDGNVVSIELDDVSPESSRLLPPLTGETSELHSCSPRTRWPTWRRACSRGRRPR